MLSVMPHAVYGRVGAVLSALIVVFSLVGLTMHRDFYAGMRRHDFFCYYTNISNLLVLVYFALIAPRLYAARSRLIPHTEYALMMCIMLTFFVFHLILFPAIRTKTMGAGMPAKELAIVLTDNLIVHYLVPWLVFLYWLLCSPGKGLLGLGSALLWTGIPLLYIAYVYLRAPVCGVIEEAGSPYPYPFLDVKLYGIRRVTLNCAALYAVCTLCGALIVCIVRAAFVFFGGGHALILI